MTINDLEQRIADALNDYTEATQGSKKGLEESLEVLRDLLKAGEESLKNPYLAH